MKSCQDFSDTHSAVNPSPTNRKSPFFIFRFALKLGFIYIQRDRMCATATKSLNGGEDCNHELLVENKMAACLNTRLPLSMHTKTKVHHNVKREKQNIIELNIKKYLKIEKVKK